MNCKSNACTVRGVDTKDSKSQGILQTARYNLERTAERLAIDQAMLARLYEPKEKIELTLNPILPGGQFVQVKTFIVRHNDALGPAKGGIRMTADVTMDDVVGLAMEMAWKGALIGVPFGGGKSGIRFDLSGTSKDAKEVIIRSFTRGAMCHIGPELYIPAPDIGTNENDMAHIRDCLSYSWGKSITDGCFVTGKPVILGGIVGRREATGRGVVYTTLAACKKLGIDIKNARVAVQGFGNVGSVAAEVIAQSGAKIVAISDVTGGIINQNGINIKNLIKHVKDTSGVKGSAEGTACDNEAVLTSDCEILIPAATQSQITVKNCEGIRAKIIAEGANSPTDPQADEMLKGRNVFIIPDILCNAGGVFVSYLEYSQETQREQMTVEQVENRLSKRMIDKFNETYDYSQANALTMRESAMNLAVSRVVEAVKMRGLLP